MNMEGKGVPQQADLLGAGWASHVKLLECELFHVWSHTQHLPSQTHGFVQKGQLTKRRVVFLQGSVHQTMLAGRGRSFCPHMPNSAVRGWECFLEVGGKALRRTQGERLAYGRGVYVPQLGALGAVSFFGEGSPTKIDQKNRVYVAEIGSK